MIYTARVPMSDILQGTSVFDSKKMKSVFAEFGGKECYIHKDELLVHFDNEEDLVAWQLRWTPTLIHNTCLELLIAEIEDMQEENPEILRDTRLITDMIRASIRK
jgi:hypothetical protein